MKRCKCPKGAQHTDRSMKHSLVNCAYCGSVYHRGCYINNDNKKKTICEDCFFVEKSKTSKKSAKTNAANNRDSSRRRIHHEASFDETEFPIRRCFIRLPRIDLSKLNYDANGRIIVLDDEPATNRSGARSNSTYTISSNTRNEYDGNALDVNDNSMDYSLPMPNDYDKIKNQSINKTDDSVIVINDTLEDEDDSEATTSSSESSFFKSLSYASFQSCSPIKTVSETQTRALHSQFKAEQPARKRFSIESSGSTNRTSTDSWHSSKSKKSPRKSNDSKLSPDYKRQRINSTEYNPTISLSDTRKNISTKYYKTTPIKSKSRLSLSSTSGYEDQSFSSSQASLYQTPIKKEMPSTIPSYFATSTSNFVYDSTPSKQSIKRKRPTPRKFSPPINLDGQRTITEMFNRPHSHST